MFNPAEEDAKWHEAIKAFGKYADGMLLMAYMNDGQTKLIKGSANDPALRDALFLAEAAAMEWANQGETEPEKPEDADQ